MSVPPKNSLMKPQRMHSPIPWMISFILQRYNVSSAVKEDDIEDIFGFLMLTDANVDKLT
jgi:hypothetical protein